MPRDLVFKFRDDVLLTPDLPLIGLFKLPPNYFELAATYVREAGIKPIMLLPADRGKSTGRQPTWTLFQPLLDLIRQQTGAAPEFLFQNNPPDAPLQLLRQILKPADNTRYPPLPQLVDPLPTLKSDVGGLYPNLYNYFQLTLPDTFSDLELSLLLSLFTALLPQLNPFFRQVYLFGYVYVKEEPTPLAFTTPATAPADKANQHYFTAMQVPNTANKGLNVGLTVIEANSWFTAHQQFGGAAFPLVFPLTSPVVPGCPFSLTAPGPNVDLPEHGTAILGILRAKTTDSDLGTTDLCRGLVPQATIKLASCITKLTFDPPAPATHIKIKKYDEPGAVLQATLGSLAGDVMLIELGLFNQMYPLEVAPAVFDLLKLAFLKNVIVVEASGNKNLYIGDSASLQPTALDRAELVDVVRLKERNAGIPWAEYLAMKTRIAAEYLALGQTATGYTSAVDFADHYFNSRTNAILVGATTDAPPAATATKEPLSSWGPRVQVYAQGQNLLTTTYLVGGLPSSSQYTAIGSTSGAAAVIAGVVTSLQGQAKASSFIITPTQMATLLPTGGTPVMKQDAPTDAPINTDGVVPNYTAAARLLQQWIDAAKSKGT